jgi:hypothetical protein
MSIPQWSDFAFESNGFKDSGTIPKPSLVDRDGRGFSLDPFAI